MKFGVYGFNTLMGLLFILLQVFGGHIPFGLYATLTVLSGLSVSIGLTYAIDLDAERSAKRIIAERERDSKAQ